MNARSCPCLGVKTGSVAWFLTGLESGGPSMNIRYRVELNEAERAELMSMLSGGAHAVRKLKTRPDPAGRRRRGDEAIASSVSVGRSTVYRTKRRFVEGNLELALSEERAPGAPRKLSGKETALLVATACSTPPEGRKRWTLDLLAGAMVRLTVHEELSRETVRRSLAEDDLKPWRRDMWCIPQVDGSKFTTQTARHKLARAYPDTAKES
jgi:transposase